MGTQHRTPDARQLLDETLPEGRFPAARGDFRVCFDAEAHAQIAKHAAENKSVEICGVLVGRWERDADGPFAIVSNYIRCDEATKKLGEVTFTHDAWTTINREMDTRFVELKIIGWYHSHPGFGVFLSERDVFIHEHFFSSPGQVAYVVDPVQKTEGLFIWRNGKPKPCMYYWVGDEICTTSEQQGAAEGERREIPAASQSLAPSPQAEPAISTTLMRTLPFFAVLLIGYFLGDMKSAWEQRRIVEGTVAHFGTWKCLRPGLRGYLVGVDEDVRVIQARVGELAEKHVKSAGDEADDMKAKWNEVLKDMQGTRSNLRVLASVYGLDPVEESVLKARLADKLTELGAPVEDKDKDKGKEPSSAGDKPSSSDAPAAKSSKSDSEPPKTQGKK